MSLICVTILFQPTGAGVIVFVVGVIVDLESPRRRGCRRRGRLSFALVRELAARVVGGGWCHLCLGQGNRFAGGWGRCDWDYSCVVAF